MNLRSHLMILLICLGCLFTTADGKHIYTESDYQVKRCGQLGGQTEYVLPDRTRVDCVLHDTKIAMEFDFAPKWAEAIGQSLYYSAVLDYQPSITLICEDTAKDVKYVRRVLEVIKAHNLPISVFIMIPEQMAD